MEQSGTGVETRVRTRELARALWPLAACALTLAAFSQVGEQFVGSYQLDLGSLTVPNVRHTYFLFYWAIFGSAAAGLGALGVTRLLAMRADQPDSQVSGAWQDRRWVGVMAALAFATACAVRWLLLRGAPLTDDESAYRFMAEVLATGRLWAVSPPLKTFFDRVFMINDGKFYSQYFLGWPLLMVPGVLVGATGYLNAVYSGLTVPALFGVTRRVGGPTAARVATLLFVASPMLLVGSATELSHPSCLMLLSWSAWCFLRGRERPEAWWLHSAFAVLFALAFCVRPTSALGVGLPFIVSWLVQVSRLPARRRNVALIAFLVPTLVMTAAFLGVNQAQNGSPLVTAYARMQAYMREVNYQYVGWSPKNPPVAISAYVLGEGDNGASLAKSAVAIVRLAFDLFGAPLAFALALGAWGVRSARIFWWSALSYVLVHFHLSDSGIDSFGPVHYYEMALPLLVLCGVGAVRMADVLSSSEPRAPRWRPLAVVGALVAMSMLGFVPVRFAALARIAANVNAPAEAVRAAGLSRAIVFSAGSFVPQDCIAPTHHFVYFRPNNDPDLRNNVLWVNHLGWEEDKALQHYFPDRSGYLLTWKACRVELLRIF